MSYSPNNPNGQAAMANSEPVVIASDQSAVPVSAASLPLPSGAATTAKQDTGNTSLASIDGKITAVNTGAVVVSSSALPSGAATAAKQPALGTAGSASSDVITVQGIASGTAQPVSGTFWQTTQPVSASSLPLPTGAATSALQTQPGVDIGDVTINNASGAGAVNIQDGGNSLTVDNGGTFAVQATLAAETTKVIGTVNQGTSPWVTSNATTSVVGNGTSAAAQRVTLANDSTGNIATIGTSVTPGTGATNLGKAEDAAHVSSDTGVFALGVRNDTLTTAVTSASGDYSQISTDTSGRVLTAAAPRALKTTQQTTITSSTAETTVLTAVASTFLDVYGVIVTNTSATVTKVTFKDSTAGTTRFVIEVPATETRGFMLPLDAAHPQAAVNTNWTATCGTSVSAIEITMLAVKMV